MGRTNLGAKELCDASETTLHSHPGGGGGPIIKSGEIVTNGSAVGSVVFGTAFADTNYAISLAGDGSVDDIIATWSNKTVNGFDVRTFDDGGKAEPNTTVNWIAISYSNS